MSSTIQGRVRSLRVRQIRLLSAVVVAAHRSRGVASLIRSARSWRLPRKVFEALAGYRRVFPTLAEAGAVAARYAGPGYDDPEYLDLHLDLAKSARPSDYPVLFHLNRIVGGETTVFDLGGCVGNLFYGYRGYLDRPGELRWTVYDLPATLESGRRIALERGETRLRFTGDLADADGVDVLLVSGALHYFEFTLHGFLESLSRKPRHILINRTPLTDDAPCATVQDANGYIVPCRLINATGLIDDLRSLGYALVDRWTVPELSVNIPFFPDRSVREYSGFYLRERPEGGA